MNTRVVAVQFSMLFFVLVFLLSKIDTFAILPTRHAKYLQRQSPIMVAQQPWGVGLSQADLMIKDECIMVSPDDKILGHTTKHDAHRFDNPQRPDGVLHRAFSVFLFNRDGKLLLQQRAADKITFPSVWTNTCCSHPLHGYCPAEVDDADEVASGRVRGIRAAAMRKLQHELGIDCTACGINADSFKYLGRIHYCSADEVPTTTTSQSQRQSQQIKPQWGEHEIDYMLFLRCQEDPPLQLNPEEVRDTRYVTLSELQRMMADPHLKWSPWFQYIVRDLLVPWWANLDTTMTTGRFVNLTDIHRF